MLESISIPIASAALSFPPALPGEFRTEPFGLRQPQQDRSAHCDRQHYRYMDHRPGDGLCLRPREKDDRRQDDVAAGRVSQHRLHGSELRPIRHHGVRRRDVGRPARQHDPDPDPV